VLSLRSESLCLRSLPFNLPQKASSRSAMAPVSKLPVMRPPRTWPKQLQEICLQTNQQSSDRWGYYLCLFVGTVPQLPPFLIARKSVVSDAPWDERADEETTTIVRSWMRVDEAWMWQHPPWIKRTKAAQPAAPDSGHCSTEQLCAYKRSHWERNGHNLHALDELI